jgi:K+-transporting ATPase KdpF subunit
MLKAITIIAVVLAVGIAGILVFALTKPDTFHVERSLALKAPANAIYPLVSDFHFWTNWSPYENRDPAMKRSFGGTASGKGATYAWDGNNNVGAGHMEILEANASSKLRIKLDFERPFEGHNTAEFTLCAARRCHIGHMGDVRSGPVHVQGDAGLHQHGQHDRQGL